MILTVTLNPAIDSTWRAAGVAPGHSHRVPTGTHRGGGKGVNVARVLHSQGFDTAVLTTAGGLTGSLLSSDLELSGIDHELIPVTNETRRSIAIYDTVADDTMIFNEAGVNNSDDEWQLLLDAAERRISSSSAVVLSGSLPSGCDPRLVARIVSLAHRSRVSTIVDTSGEALVLAARAGASILKPNRDELTATVGGDDVLAGARALIAEGAGSVVVSLGARGLVLVAGDNEATPAALRGLTEPLLARLAAPLSGNPTGAGDAAVAALAASLTDSPTELLRRAVAWSAAAVLMPAAGEISPRHPEIATTVIVENLTEPTEL